MPPRPGTRSGMPPPPTGFNQYGPPPSTGIRPPTSTIRPSSGLVRQGTATGMRPGTGQLGQPGYGLAGTPLGITARPITQHGVQGMGTAAQGSYRSISVCSMTVGLDRQVMDPSYYIGLLRTKISELQAEITKINQNDEQLQRDTALYNSLEKKFDIMMRSLLNLLFSGKLHWHKRLRHYRRSLLITTKLLIIFAQNWKCLK